MDIGLLTAPLTGKPLEWVIDFARRNGFQALEVVAGPGSKHLDTAGMSDARVREVKDLLGKSGVRISSLAWYANLIDPDEAKREPMAADMRGVIDAAVALGVDVVCTLAGMPLPGKDRMATIEGDFPGVFAPLTEYAGGGRGFRVTTVGELGSVLQAIRSIKDEPVIVNVVLPLYDKTTTLTRVSQALALGLKKTRT